MTDEKANPTNDPNRDRVGRRYLSPHPTVRVKVEGEMVPITCKLIHDHIGLHWSRNGIGEDAVVSSWP